MEEVFVTDKVGNRLETKRYLRPVGQKDIVKPKVEENSMDIAGLLGEGKLSSDDEEDEVVGAEPEVQASEPSEVVLDKLMVLKLCFEEGYLTKEEHDLKRRAVLQQMILEGVVPSSNPSRVVGRTRDTSPETLRKQEAADDARYIQNRYKHVYATGVEGSGLDKNATMMMQPTGVDGIYMGVEPKVVDTIEEQLPDRKVGPEHKFNVVKTTIKKELLDTGVVRVTRTEKIYDGYSNAYITMNKSEKMMPKLSFHSNEEFEKDPEFQMQTGTSKHEGDKVEAWRSEMHNAEDNEYNRVMTGALEGRNYSTHNVNNTAGKGDFGWDGVYRFPGGKPEEPEKQKKGLFGRKKAPAKDPNDKWSGFEDNWEEDEADPKNRGRKGVGNDKPGYKDGGRKGLFQVKKAQPKTRSDKNMGEDPNNYKMKNPVAKSNADREFMWDDGRGRGGFGTGEQWGADAKQHEGQHAAGGSHFTHRDMWK